jgi:3',5'-cyclic-AMP phosphodiesterase
MATVVQITDLHLFKTRSGTLHGVSTWTQLDRALAEVQRRWPAAERLVVTGDIAHDEVQPTYTLLSEALGEWADRTVVIPGNHDHREGLQAVFPGQSCGPEGAWMGFEEHVGVWQLIGLDTHQPGLEAGGLSDAQLEWCAERLRRHAPKPSLLFMHHPPVPVGSDWLDVIALSRPAGFHDLVRQASNLRGIVCGHVHQHFEGRLHGLPVLATPSTAFQFAPGLPHFAMDTRPAGLRVFELEAGGWKTEVVWLEPAEAQP